MACGAGVVGVASNLVPDTVTKWYTLLDRDFALLKNTFGQLSTLQIYL